MPRPEKEAQKSIDPQHIGGMAQSGATDEEIAAYFGLTVATVRRKYKRDLKYARAARRIRLRQAQTKVATDGNATMLIFLGKSELGQGEAPAEADDVRVMRRVVDRERKPDPEHFTPKEPI